MAEPRGKAGHGGFPTTRASLLQAIRSGDEGEQQRSREVIASVYWRPVYKYVRLKWPSYADEAEDLTQGFLAIAFEKDYFASYDPAKARFRTFLRMCLERYVENHRQSQSRVKRGGGSTIVPLNVPEAEGELHEVSAYASQDPEAFFENEWKRCLFGDALQLLKSELEARSMTRHYRVFERYDLADDDARPTYAEIAAEMGVSIDDVGNSLRFVRREFRRVTLEQLRKMSASEEEFRLEADALFGKRP